MELALWMKEQIWTAYQIQAFSIYGLISSVTSHFYKKKSHFAKNDIVEKVVQSGSRKVLKLSFAFNHSEVTG